MEPSSVVLGNSVNLCKLSVLSETYLAHMCIYDLHNLLQRIIYMCTEFFRWSAHCINWPMYLHYTFKIIELGKLVA